MGGVERNSTTHGGVQSQEKGVVVCDRSKEQELCTSRERGGQKHLFGVRKKLEGS